MAATQKTLWAVGASSPTILPANYWTIGKTVKLTAFLKCVTAATPGNYAFGMCYGSADAPAANVVTSATAAVASQTFSAVMQGFAVCRSLGTAGTLSMWGWVIVDLLGVLSTAQPKVFPTAGGTVVSTVDTTVGTNALSFQASRSGSTAETIQVVGLLMEALN